MFLQGIFEPGIGRDLAIGLKFVIIALCLQFAIFMLRDFIRALRTHQPVQLIPAWMVFFGAFCVTEILYFIGDIYGTDRVLLLDVGYSIMMFSATGLLYILESGVPYKTRGIFWKISFGLAVLILFLPRDPSRYLLFLTAGPIYAVFIVVFLFHLKKNYRGKAVRPIWWFFVGLFLALFGTVFSADLFINNYGMNYYLGGNALTALGFGFMGVSALAIRSFQEFEWPEVVQQILISRLNGELLYSYSFTSKETVDEKGVSAYLMSSGLSGISAMLKEISQSSSSVRYIDLRDTAIEFFYGKFIVGVIFAKGHLDITHTKIRRLITKIENSYGGYLRTVVFSGFQGKALELLVAEEFGQVMTLPEK